MGIFTKSINKNLILKDNPLEKYITSASFAKTSSNTLLKDVGNYSASFVKTSLSKDVGRYSIKSGGKATPTPTSFTRAKLKIKSPSANKFTLSNTAKSADIPFKTNTQSLSKTKIISPSSHISADEIADKMEMLGI